MVKINKILIKIWNNKQFNKLIKSIKLKKIIKLMF